MKFIIHILSKISQNHKDKHDIFSYVYPKYYSDLFVYVCVLQVGHKT